jgi:hypothetical protein
VNTGNLPRSESQAQVADDASAPQYAISASASLQERRTRTLKHGETFAVFDQRGDIGGEPGNSEGLYHRDTRILSQFQMLLEESRPLLLSSMTQDDNAVPTSAIPICSWTDRSYCAANCFTCTA